LKRGKKSRNASKFKRKRAQKAHAGDIYATKTRIHNPKEINRERRGKIMTLCICKHAGQRSHRVRKAFLRRTTQRSKFIKMSGTNEGLR